MSNIMTKFGRATHSERLERWLGPELTAQMSANMKPWYGPPIAVAGTPGKVWAHGGGDFSGPIGAGQFINAIDFSVDRLKKAVHNSMKRQMYTLNTGFSSLSDLISEASGGKSRYYQFQKAGTTGVVGAASSLWRAGNTPSVGLTPGNAAGGTAFTDASAGGFPFTNPGSPDTQHFVRADIAASVVGNSLLLYDLIFGCNKTMASTANESVTGVPTRYQSSTTTAMDYAGGNFMFIQVGGTALAATAHDWGVAGGSNECLYRNQAGTDNSIMPVLTGNISAIVDRLDHPVAQWFCPLAAGDTGVMDLAQMRCSASVATGVIWFMIGHPIAMMPCPVANMVCVTDGINTAFNLVRIFDDACLAFLEMPKPVTTATTYVGIIQTVAG